ncbi:MAG TPA: hypothetical protein VL418_11785 [Devosiaceae bacterium]|nr:hypothetical protein [Devosiaceae bacterium]
MYTIAQKLVRLSEQFGGALRPIIAVFDGFSASWNRLMERNAARGRVRYDADDDILWDSGEPDEQATH